MTRVFRILRKPFSKKPLAGEGAFRFGGRWSSPGVRIAYTAEHLSLAMLEYFVHIDSEDPPKDLVMVSADVPDNVPRISIAPKLLPPDWRQVPSPPALAAIGDEFVQKERAALLIVPSALAPSESNWLINPRHPASARIRVNPSQPFQYESRFFK